MSNSRNRPVYAVAILLVIVAGLTSRSSLASYLPMVIATYAGDTLWALTLFLVLGFGLVRARTGTIALLTIALSFCVELSQLYKAGWLDAIRATQAGALVLGAGFKGSDLVCYTVGCLLGVVGETVSRARERGWTLRGHTTSRGFLGRPALRRIGLLLGVGVAVILCAYMHVRSRRPREVPRGVAVLGIRKVDEMLECVEQSAFGRSTRGGILTAAASRLVDEGRVKFSPNMKHEALYRDEMGRRPVLYISVFCHGERVDWPRPVELAQRIYHETLHSVMGSRHRSIEEECDAFCAAEEAAAAVERRLPRYPVMRDGKPIEEWVKDVYSQYPSSTTYVPVGCTVEELAARTGIAY